MCERDRGIRRQSVCVSELRTRCVRTHSHTNAFAPRMQACTHADMHPRPRHTHSLACTHTAPVTDQLRDTSGSQSASGRRGSWNGKDTCTNMPATCPQARIRKFTRLKASAMQHHTQQLDAPGAVQDRQRACSLLAPRPRTPYLTVGVVTRAPATWPSTRAK